MLSLINNSAGLKIAAQITKGAKMKKEIEPIEIKVKDILGINVALSDSQADKVMKKIDFKGWTESILDFDGVTDVTAAFFRRILTGFSGKSARVIKSNLQFKNHNDSVNFAFEDAIKEFEKQEKKFLDYYTCLFETQAEVEIKTKIRYAISVAMPRRWHRKVGWFNFSVSGWRSSNGSDLKMSPEKWIEHVNNPRYMFTKEDKKRALENKERFDSYNAVRRENGNDEEKFMQEYHTVKFYGLKERWFKQLVKQLRKQTWFDGSELTLYHYRWSM